MKQVASVIAFVLGVPGCAAILENGTARSEVDAIDGQQVKIGYFEPAGQDGDYALLSKPGTSWQVKQLAHETLPVVTGQELLFVRKNATGAVEITPVYGGHSAISDGGSMIVCDPREAAYSACNSTFSKHVPLLPEMRKVDRDAIALAVRESRLLARLAEISKDVEASTDRAGRVQRRRANLRVGVAKVENAPQVVTVTSEQASAVLAFEAESPDGEGETFRVVPRFERLSVSLPSAEVDCFLLPEKPDYVVEHVSATAVSPLGLAARVDYCDVKVPRPTEFVAAEKGEPVVIKVVSFDPRGSTQLALSNSSSKYVTVSSLSLYYFGKILTEDKPIELAPAAEHTTTVQSTFPIDASFSHVTAAQLTQKTFAFGVAAKYTAGDGGGAKTLLSVRQITLKSVLPPVAPN